MFHYHFPPGMRVLGDVEGRNSAEQRGRELDTVGSDQRALGLLKQNGELLTHDKYWFNKLLISH